MAFVLISPPKLGIRISIALCGGVLAIYSFSSIKEIIGTGTYSITVILLIWGSVTAVVAIVFFALSRFKAFPNAFLVALAVMNGIPLLGITYAAQPTNSRSEKNVSFVRSDVEPKVKAVRPDIIYLVLDEYGRADTLRNIHSYDNSEFVEELRKRGFYVAEKAISNYPRTFFSINSVLNMEFHDLESDPSPIDGRWQQHTFVGNNKVVRYLQSRGYRYDFFEKGYFVNGFQCLGYEEYCIRCESKDISVFELRVLDLTPASIIIRRFFPETYQKLTAACEFNDLTDRLRPSEERPIFLFGHILAPHYPYRFTSECGRTESIVLPSDVDLETERSLYIE